MAYRKNPRSDLASRIQPEVPHAARIWNYWMGGRDNFDADRVAGDAVAAVYPDIVAVAMESRKFLIRVVRHLAADAGVSQFLDIGTGLPTMQNTHEIAQSVIPSARVVYVDNDPLVLAHARVLLGGTTPEGVTTYIEGDFHDPRQIISDARNVLDFTKPIAVMFMGVLGFVEGVSSMTSIVRETLRHMPSGSYLVLWDGTSTSDAVAEGAAKLAASGALPYHLRTLDEVAACFEDLRMVEPGLVPISHWRLDTSEPIRPIDAYGAVGRKP